MRVRRVHSAAALAAATGLASAVLSFGSAAAQPAAPAPAPGTIAMLTEDYRPMAFLQEGQIVGSSVEQVRRIMSEVHPDYTLEIMPWARAIATAAASADTCVFTTTLLPEREARFKWVLPLNEDRLTLVGRDDGQALPATIEAAKALTVAVHRGDVGEIFAKANGFEHLDVAPSADLSLKKLLAGRVDLLLLTGKAVEELREKGAPVRPVFDVDTTRSGIACNRSVPDETIAAMQAALDRLIADGFQAETTRRYRGAGK